MLKPFVYSQSIKKKKPRLTPRWTVIHVWKGNQGGPLVVQTQGSGSSACCDITKGRFPELHVIPPLIKLGWQKKNRAESTACWVLLLKKFCRPSWHHKSAYFQDCLFQVTFPEMWSKQKKQRQSFFISGEEVHWLVDSHTQSDIFPRKVAQPR